MFGNPVSSGLTFTKVISGISKTLNVANQIIPLYREAKPMIQNAKTILSVFKSMNTNTNNSSNNNNVSTNTNNNIKKEVSSPKTYSSNGPNFFL